MSGFHIPGFNRFPTSTPIHASSMTVGTIVKFNYNGKVRVGKVDKVGSRFVTLEIDEEHRDDPKDKYRSFSFDKIQGEVFAIVV